MTTRIDPAMIYIADEKFLKAVQDLLDDIGSCRSSVGGCWYAGFSEFRVTEQGEGFQPALAEIEWPNLTISAAALQAQLDRTLRGQ